MSLTPLGIEHGPYDSKSSMLLSTLTWHACKSETLGSLYNILSPRIKWCMNRRLKVLQEARGKLG